VVVTYLRCNQCFFVHPIACRASCSSVGLVLYTLYMKFHSVSPPALTAVQVTVSFTSGGILCILEKQTLCYFTQRNYHLLACNIYEEISLCFNHYGSVYVFPLLERLSCNVYMYIYHHRRPYITFCVVRT